MFLHHQPFFFKRIDFGLIGRDHTRAGRVYDPVQQSGNLGFQLTQLAVHGLGGVLHLFAAHLPSDLEHIADQAVCRLGGLQLLQELFKLAFKRIAADRLAFALAALGEAQIVRMLLARLAF
ncbi:hypothetical protein [Algicella marina]|uniref:hypothetical protein n=1 Tax=Algicella marina TaxID=2683284 RepID=UPI0024DFD945|nr:hypothetical protein [Algicella marina]